MYQEVLPIDRLRGLQNSGKDRTFADRLRNTSRSIGPTMRVAQQERRSIGRPMKTETVSQPVYRGTHPIDRQNFLMHYNVVFQTF